MDPVVIRALGGGGAPALVAVVEATGVFRPEEVEVAREVLETSAAKGEASGYFTAVAVEGGVPVGFSCHGPTPCTRGTFDLYWLVVHPASQGRGAASRLLAAASADAARRGARQLIAETSSTDAYGPARRFYEARGFRVVARVPDFYRVGDAKIIYLKPLQPIDQEGDD